MHVAVIGGGVIGLCSAYYLSEKGFKVTVIDRGNFRDGCSFGNAGYVAPSHFTPLATPGIIAQGLRWMLHSSSPFYIKPRLDPAMVRWGLTFWKSADQSVVERNIPHLSALLNLSRKLTAEMHTRLGANFFMEEKGCLMMYKSAATEVHEKHLAEKAAGLGIETKILSGSEVQALEPQVEVDVRGAVLYPIDAHLHPGEMMLALHQHLEKHGVQFVEDCPVHDFEKMQGSVKAVHTVKGRLEADAFVLAAGSWLPLLARKLGISILLQAGKGYSVTYPDVARNLSYPAILVDSRVAMTPLGSSLRMGGTMEISGINNNILMKRVMAIYQASKKYYPSLEVPPPEKDMVWTGLRPLSPDGLPYIGRSNKYNNMIIAGGHAMLGLSLAAATGKLTEELISGCETTVPHGAFAVNRFARHSQPFS